MQVSIATWNLHQAVDKRPANTAATWRFLQEAVRPSVALVQEAATIPETPGGAVSSAAGRGYSTAVLGYELQVEPMPPVTTKYNSKVRYPIEPTTPGTFAAARVTHDGEADAMVAISMYGLLDPVYAQRSVLRALADLIPLADSPAYRRRVVVGGDLNVWDQDPRDRASIARWRAVFPLFETLGLINLFRITQPDRGPLAGCPCSQRDCWHVETYRPVRQWKSGTPGFWTIDYLFATKELVDRLSAFEVWNDRADAWELSDHIPVVARFDL